MHSLYQTTNHLALLVLEEKMVKVSAIQNQEVPILAMFFFVFKPQSDHTKDYKSDICYFNAKNAALMLAQNQDNVSE